MQHYFSCSSLGETEEEGLTGQSYEEAYAFYKEKFPEVTEEAIDQFRTRYIGSEEEKEDIIDFVEKWAVAATFSVLCASLFRGLVSCFKLIKLRH